MSGDERERGNAASRRTVLKAAAATGALAGIGDVGRAQATEIELEGDTGGWVGRSPESIAGETNPMLPLEAGQTYSVTWTNGDGAPHSFIVENAEGDRLAGTQIVEQEGESRTVELEATPAMAEYYCEVHPDSMRGEVSVSGGTTTGDETTAEAETTTEESQPPVIYEDTIVLGGRAAHWLGLAPGSLWDRENPTLRLRGGREYQLVWMNLDGQEHDFRIVGADGEEVAATSARQDVGATHDTTFEATDGMAEYYCDYHPESMRGNVEVI